MQPPRSPSNNDQSGTYFVSHRKQEELDRLIVQDEMLTASMGGALPEQPDVSSFHRVLDIGCGPGKWLINAARTYPHMSLLIGIDINPQMIEVARAEAERHGVAERIEWHVMDALRMLEFPNGFFDLVNLRLGNSFLRSWDWPKILNEMRRVTRFDGVIRVTETNEVQRSNSAALTRFFEMFICAYSRSGRLNTEEGVEDSMRLVSQLKKAGCQQVQARPYIVEFKAGTPACQAYCEDLKGLMQNIRPFIEKWGCGAPDYEDVTLQALEDMQKSDFTATWNLLTVWSTVQQGPSSKPH